MNHWPFIIAAYSITIVAGGILAIISYLAMRRAERR